MDDPDYDSDSDDGCVLGYWEGTYKYDV
jgi:hypothetical protein